MSRSKTLNGKKIGAFLIWFLITGILSHSFGQFQDDLAFILRSRTPAIIAKEESFLRALESGTELRSAVVGLLRFYQIFVSSQDTSICNFTLSCSQFGMAAVQKYGILHGLLMASDRLQRCNGLSRKYYQQDPKTTLAIDFPLEVYYLGWVKK